MPQVPIYNKPQVQQAGLSNAKNSVQASEEAYGGGASAARVTEAAQGLIGSASKFVEQEKAKADDTASQAAYADLMRRKQRLLFDPKEGALNRRGKDAFGVADEFGVKFDKEADDIASTLSSPAQRDMFAKIRSQQRVDLTGDLERHTMGESRKFEEETTASAISAARDEAVLNYAKPGAVESNINLQRSLILDHAQKNGKDAQVVQQELSKITSQTHSAVIERMLATGRDQDAQAYFATNKASITHGIADVEKVLEAGSMRGESQRQSDAIVAQHSDMGAALTEARKIADPKIRDATTERVKDYFAQQKSAERQQREDLMIAGGNAIDQTGDFFSIPDKERALLSPSEKASLMAYAKHKREGTEPEANGERYYDLKTLAATPAARSKFLQMNLREHIGDLTKSEMHEMISIQTSLREKDGKADAILDGYRSDQQIVKDGLLAAGISATPKKGTADAEKVAAFHAKVDQQLAVWQKQNGKKAPNEVVQSIVDNLLIKGVTEKGTFWDTKKRAFELAPGENLDISATDVPRSERSKIEQALKKRGIPVSDERIKELYSRKLQGTVLSGN